jgi:hypothetical protein
MVLSAVVVFIVSSMIHMVVQFHKSDYKKLPDEDSVIEAMTKAGVQPGDYWFPYATGPKDLENPDMKAKWERGPVGSMIIRPSGLPAMGKYLVMWFAFSLVVSFFTAYLASRTLAAGTHYLQVFRVVGVTAFMGYSFAYVSDSIWKGQSWSITAKHVFDGLLYGLFTAGVFGWLWP